MDFNLEGVRWNQPTITWSLAAFNFTGQPGGPFSNSISDTIEINDIINAFAQWGAASGLNFVEVNDAADTDIRFGFGSIDGVVGGTIGLTTYFSQNGVFSPGITIRFDSIENYFIQNGEVYVNNTNNPFEALALHEIGHALGLDHYNLAPAVMNSSAGTNTTLKTPDIDGIQYLYGSPQTDFKLVTAWDFNWHVIATGDFNHDGTTDVIWDNGHGVEGGWLMGNDTRAGTLQLPFFPDWHTVATGDFNGDGVTDIMWQSANGLVAEWFMGSGTRQATAAIQNMAGWTVIATGDFNHDGISDVIWDNGSGVEGGWLMNRNGQIGGTLQLPFFPAWTVIATGDFNADGNTDIMWKSASGLVAEWFMGSGTRQATAAIQNMSGWDVIATGDFNHDGTMDILWRNAAGQTSAWLMKNGSIFAITTYENTSGWNVVASGDFNHDGFGDVMWQNKSTGAVAIWNFTTGAGVVRDTALDATNHNDLLVKTGDAPAASSGGSFPIANGGNDTFVFAPNFGRKVISDFNNHDTIQIDHNIFSNIADLLAHTADDGQGNVVITADLTDTITLLGITKSVLQPDHFHII
jgi:hypothetical protein